MASAKRKDVPAHTKDGATSSRKRPRLEKNEPPKKKKLAQQSSAETPLAATVTGLTSLSTLHHEPPAFPRGGADILTPLEKKQLRAKAERDVLIEQQAGNEKDLFGPQAVDENDSENSAGPAPKAVKIRKKPKFQSRSQDSKTQNGDAEIVRIEGLNYKRLIPGTLILGRVASINRRDLQIALPNNLAGFVPLTGISPRYTRSIETLLDQDNEENETKRPDADADADGANWGSTELGNYFQVGQWLRVVVTSTGDEASPGTKRSKKRIELSLDPALTNASLATKDLAINCTLQVAVASIEDRGVIVDIGLSDPAVQGFISTQDLPEDVDMGKLKPGTVFLCVVKSFESGGRTVKLSSRIGSDTDQSSRALKSAPSVHTFLPGTLVEILLSEVRNTGLTGKVMGMLDVTSDVVQSGARSVNSSFEANYDIGAKIIGRLITLHPESQKLGFSMLDPIKQARQHVPRPSDLKLSSILDSVTVVRVEPGLGIFVTLGVDSQEGFVHMSRLSDNKISTISQDSGSFKVGSKHRARLLDYNSVDNLFLLSLQKSVIEQPFLRLEDVEEGRVVKAKVEKLVQVDGDLRGLVIELSDGVSGFVSKIHLSDSQLLQPEKKFREGSTVSARVLMVDAPNHKLRLTLKKSLVNSDLAPWTHYSQIKHGKSSLGTLVKVQPNGAIVQFYGPVRGYLPVSEMSEAFIKDATQHFREGQVLNVHCLHVDAENSKLTVSCRDPSDAKSDRALEQIKPGTVVKGTVFEKSEDDVLLRLDESDIIARLELDQIVDGSLQKRNSALKKIRVGQKLSDLLVLEVQVKRRLVKLCNRATLLEAMNAGTLLHDVHQLREQKQVTGQVSNITTDGVFVLFAGGLTGLLAKSHIPSEAVQLADFGFTRLQIVTATISSIDYKVSKPRFWLSFKEPTEESQDPATKNELDATDIIDGGITNVGDLQVGAITKACITSVKETQINVQLAKDIFGRISVSEIFDKWEDIKDRKKPLQIFSPKQVVTVRILGVHDSRNHRFLPISHRAGKTAVFELSAKPSFLQSKDLETLTYQRTQVGSSWLAYVNNIGDDCLWVNISPNVRGRIRKIDVSDDLSLVSDLATNFPLGSALRVHVVSVDADKSHLDLSAKSTSNSKVLTINDLSEGMILPGRVTKATERQAFVQLNENLVGTVNLIDLADDFSKANPTLLQKNQIVRAIIVNVDVPNKRIGLSLRPSKVLSSSLPVEDREITSLEQLKVGDIVRGFVFNVSDQGLFVTVGHDVQAFVRITNLSDSFIKDWKSGFERDQLVSGKVISVDGTKGRLQISLKESVMNPDYVPPVAFEDLNVGQVVTGKVARVEEFGVFILIDNSANLRGLCHRSEIGEKRVLDARTLFNEGDVVKAKVLKLDTQTRKMSLGLKASYFQDDIEMEDEDAESEEGGVKLAKDDSSEDENMLSEDGSDVDKVEDSLSKDYKRVTIQTNGHEDTPQTPNGSNSISKPADNTSHLSGLQLGGFNWTGLPNIDEAPSPDEIQAPSKKQKKRHHKAVIYTDHTSDLDTHGPQSPSDFERLLLTSPDSSLLWLQYMAHHLSLGEIDTARSLAQRALRTISPVGGQSETEKLNLWIALLNLENTYGDPDSVETTFKAACQVNDPQEIHERLASIYIQSSKPTAADTLFGVMLKKFGSADPKIWLNYASFLFDTVHDPERARALLARALQTLPQSAHVDITAKFAGMEFRSRSGLAERGRTIFEGLLDGFPKRVDLWNVLLDLEMRYGDGDGDNSAPDTQAPGNPSNPTSTPAIVDPATRQKAKLAQIRRIFNRIFAPPSASGGSSSSLKSKQARFFFKRWLEFEEAEGDQRHVDAVKKRAEEWVRDHGKTKKEV